MPHCIPLSTCSSEQIATCLNLAFSDYAITVSLSSEQLETFLHERGAAIELSYAAIDGEQLVGLLVHAVGYYRGAHGAFTIVAGVIPTHRSQGIFSQLYEHARPLLRAQGVASY